jgi:hypothetical protein
MSQSTTTPIKQAKPLASSTGEKDAIHMIEKLEIKTKAMYVNKKEITGQNKSTS